MHAITALAPPWQGGNLLLLVLYFHLPSGPFCCLAGITRNTYREAGHKPQEEREMKMEHQLMNPLATDGFEFVEYTAPDAESVEKLKQLFLSLGFVEVARHRSKDVSLFRQGDINFILDAERTQPAAEFAHAHGPSACAMAWRVKDAAKAYEYALAHGAWEIPVRALPMELNIPAIHGVGESLVYFVDRYDEFSIYDIDFRAIPTVDPHPEAIADMHYFGIVQYVKPDRTADWAEFYSQLMGFTPLPRDVRFGIMPSGLLLESPCRTFFLQLIEPEDSARFAHMDEHLQRIGIGTPDVLAAVASLEKRGVGFLATDRVKPSERGALTRPLEGGMMFELVKSQPPGARSR